MKYSNEIKCGKCGRWNHWHNRIFDICYFCGEFLDVQNIYKEAREQEKTTIRESTHFLIIRKEDKWYLRILKRILTVVNLIFIALVTFMVFLISITPG
jgi:hypothetical protein